MSEPVRPTQSNVTAPPVSPVPPGQPAGRPGGPGDPGASDESVRRKLLMGVALMLALASIYAGVFNAGRLAQIVLAAAATMAVVMALTSKRERRDS